MVVLRVSKADAETARVRAIDAGVFDRTRRIAQREGRVAIPLRHAPPPGLLDGVDAEVTEADLPLREWFRDPHETVRHRLEGDVPDELLATVPRAYVRLGDVVVLDLPDALDGHARTVGRAFGKALSARSVVDVDVIDGELREPAARHLWGETDTRTVHREHGIAYELDPMEVMFSPGNKTERRRMQETDLAGRTVVDLFAGVGQLGLPAAKAGADVVACEKNPTAAAFLQANVERNGLEEQVEVRVGDSREVAPAGVADVVLMGLLPDARPFLDVARRALGPDGGHLLLHEVRTTDADVEVPDGTRLADLRVVKTYGPCREHVVLDLEVPA